MKAGGGAFQKAAGSWGYVVGHRDLCTFIVQGHSLWEGCAGFS